jgi:hypothetical protein
MSHNRCIGAILQRDGLGKQWIAVLIYEDSNYRYTFTMWTNEKIKAQLWLDNNSHAMPQYYDKMTRISREA